MPQILISKKEDKKIIALLEDGKLQEVYEEKEDTKRLEGNIYLGKIQGIEIIWIIGKQLIWVLVMYLLAKVFFNKAVKKVTINGG